MDLIIDGLEAKKSGDKYRDHVLDDAIYHIKKAKECLEKGLKDPKAWWADNMITTKAWIPYMYLMLQQQASRSQESLLAEESSPTEPLEGPTDEDISSLE